MSQLTQLYPLPTRQVSFEGLYLSHDLRQAAQAVQAEDRIYVYANLIASLDGRIAVPRPSGGIGVPRAIANERDWRLFQELAAQADVILSSGRYLREWAAGRAQEILQVDDPHFADLRDWRQSHGLAPHPDIAIVSGSLQFPIPDVLTAGGRKVVVFTSGEPDVERVREIQSQAGQVIVAGKARVEGDRMIQALGELGYRVIYSSAGPQILHTLLAGGVLNRLYLTQAPKLLGGDPYASILEGALLDPPRHAQLHSLYLDSSGLDGLGQLFLSYDILPIQSAV
jgi:riboflavin biosynthesis pyrimidine reductase